MGMVYIMNITDKVNAKLKEGYLELYFHKEIIGKLTFLGEEKLYHLNDGYAYEDGKVLKLIDVSSVMFQPYVEGCDLGWC